MFYPTLEMAKQLSAGNAVFPVALEMMADVKTPIEILRNMKESSQQFYILESVTGSDNWSRYTFLGYDPVLTVSGRDGAVFIQQGGKTEMRTDPPAEVLREILGRYQSPKVEGLPPFTGGFVGYFSYDFMKYVVPAPVLQGKNPEGFDDFHLMLIDKVIAFDHFRQKIFLITNVSAIHPEESYIQAVSTLKDMERFVLAATTRHQETAQCGSFSALFSKETFCEKVKTLQHHIKEGDIFQAVLSNRFTAPFTGTLLETYRVLRTINPSPYMVYLSIGDMEIACASPETLITLRENQLSTFPLAGTRPRTENEQENKQMEKDLLADEKELCEHDMLVDLARNDLGKISAFGTVKTEQLHEVKHYSHVMHISTHVTGELAPGLDALDAVMATLPAGTLSGAPKKRACELIDNLEGVRRGPYGGAMGYLDFTGNADFCIGIRMALHKGDHVFVQSGAGIVADSVPETEYEESLHKAQAMMKALDAEVKK